MVFDCGWNELGWTYNRYHDENSTLILNQILQRDPSKWIRVRTTVFEPDLAVELPSFVHCVPYSSSNWWCRSRGNRVLLHVNVFTHYDTFLHHILQPWSFSEEFHMAWKALPTSHTPNNHDAFLRFFETFGTHFRARVKVGTFFKFEDGVVTSNPPVYGPYSDELMREWRQIPVPVSELTPIPSSVDGPNIDEVRCIWGALPYDYERERRHAIQQAFRFRPKHALWNELNPHTSFVDMKATSFWPLLSQKS